MSINLVNCSLDTGKRNEAAFMDPESWDPLMVPGWFQSEFIDAYELVLALNDDILYK